MPDDLGKELKKDYRRYKKLQAVGDGDSMGIGKKVEVTLWALCVMSLVGMMVAMFFTGPDKAIAGETWLLASLGSITFFGGAALITRQFPEV